MLTQTQNEIGLTCLDPGTYRCGDCNIMEREVADFATFPVCGFCHTGVRWIMVQPVHIAEIASIN